MGILDGDGKPYEYVRQVLTKEFYKKIGEHFGARILEEQIKDEPVLKMMNSMFGSTQLENTTAEIKELGDALKLLSEQPVEEE